MFTATSPVKTCLAAALGLAMLAFSQPSSAQHMGHSGAAPETTIKVGEITISDPWIKEPPPNAQVSGGYMSITNNGKEADRLIAVSIPLSDKTEVHEMAIENDVMRMRELADGLEIKPGETAVLKPGSFHIMFMKLNGKITEGDKITGDITFEKAGKTAITFTVRKVTSQPQHNMQGH